MAKNKDYRPEDIAFPDQVIVESELVKEMKDSYIDYAVSVIVGRALPDVRDGLKPVHRRILYSMYESGLTSDKPFKNPPPAWATCWASITPTGTDPCMTPWSGWPRISPCVTGSSTATATSGPWTATSRGLSLHRGPHGQDGRGDAGGY